MRPAKLLMMANCSVQSWARNTWILDQILEFKEGGVGAVVIEMKVE